MATIELDQGERDIWRIVQSVISIIRKWNSTGEVTLTAGATTTVVTKSVAKGAVNVGKDDQILLSPRTANAAAAISTTYISSVGQGTFTITHANAGTLDRTFGWAAR